MNNSANRLLLVDNNDSFTYNVVNLLKSICSWQIDVVEHSRLDISNIRNYQALIISPGPSHPDDYPILRQIIDKYLAQVPILGICLGHQVICKYFGAEIVNYTTPLHGVEAKIDCSSDSILFQGVDTMLVGRYHSWVARGVDTPLRVVARDDNGDIMAVESAELKIFGVQFHPESYISKMGDKLITNFLNEALR